MTANKATNPPPGEIRAAREAVGHSQQFAAEQVYVSKRQWQNWEAGAHPMPRAAWELYSLKTGQPERVRWGSDQEIR